MATFSNQFGAKTSILIEQNYVCTICHYKCSKKFNWERHILTSKHINATKINKVSTNNEQKEQKQIVKHLCEYCNKEYNDRTGLWRHKKKCNIEEKNMNTILNPDQSKTTQEIEELKEFMKYLMKENSEMKNMMIDVIKNGTSNTSITNITNNNSHNKSFNLNLFLNETCKNAMNITDFVNSLQLQLSDLENVGEVGYIEGISNIIIKKLNALDVTERPVHCTDKKRETMYIKDEDKWEKEDDNKTKLHKMVRKVSNKNIDLISNFKELHPDWKKSTSKVSDQFNKIIIESMGGAGDNDFEKEEKIIKKVAKAVFIDKTI
jgi:hypothetical protein